MNGSPSNTKYALWGGGVGLALLALAFEPAAGGATWIPLYLFFAPVVLVSQPAVSLGVDTLIFFPGCPLLYIGYAIFLARGNRRREGPKTFLVLALFHFAPVALCFLLWTDGDSYADLLDTGERAPFLIVTGFALFFLALWLFMCAALKIRPPLEGPPRCRKCDYNLTGNTSGVCPECGEEIQSNPIAHRPNSQP